MFRRNAESPETFTSSTQSSAAIGTTKSPERKARTAEEEKTPSTESSEFKKPEKVK
mgnify:CR=1 FL=1